MRLKLIYMYNKKKWRVTVSPNNIDTSRILNNQKFYKKDFLNNKHLK